MEWGELGTCDSGAGSFLPSLAPSWGGGSGHSAPGKGRVSSPTDTTHRAPTSVRTLSSPHPTRPHTSSCRRDFWHPPLFSFRPFQPAGEHGHRCFPCESVFFGSGQSWIDMDFQMPMPCLRRHLPLRKQEGGAASMGGGRLVEVPLPTTAAGFPPDRPPLPPAEIPPPSSDPTKMTLFHCPPHHLAPREKSHGPWGSLSDVRISPPFVLGLVTCIS